MEDEEIKLVHRIIRKYGDSFWQEENNEYLFDDILSMLQQAGYDLKLVRIKK